MISLHSAGLAIEERELFKDISIEFPPSSIIWLKGKNGSGKTALLRSLAGIRSLTSGKITVGTKKVDIGEIPKPYCTYIGHKFAIKPELSVIENLEFWADSYNSAMLIDAAILYFSMQNIMHKKCYELSAGNQKKVALSRLLACPSKLWLLDEVDSNLDEENKKLLINLITIHANNGGITFFASHADPGIKTAQTLDLDKYSGEKK